MTHSAYSQLPAVNWSLLRELAQSPAHYAYRLANPRTDTPQMALGRLVHCAVLEPDALPERYAVWNGARRGKDWGTFADIATERGMEVVTTAEYEKALAVRDAVRGHPAVQAYLARYESEVTLTWTDAATGIACKARADLVTDGYLVELKTTGSGIDPRSFARTCAKFGYHGQLAFYLRGLARPVTPVLIAVEPEAPHDVAVYEPDEDFVWAGDELVTELLAKLKHCQETDEWPGAYESAQALALPGWYFDEMEEGSR